MGRPGAVDHAREAVPRIAVDSGLPAVGGADLAGTGGRVVAYVIDYLILLGATIVLSRILDELLVQGLVDGPDTLNAVRGVGSFVLDAAYFIGLWTGGRRTIGMWLLGIRVVRAEDAGEVRFLPAAKRWLVINLANLLFEVAFRVLPTDIEMVGALLSVFAGLVWPLVLLASVARNPDHQGLHDRIAGTLVVVSRRRTPRDAR